MAVYVILVGLIAALVFAVELIMVFATFNVWLLVASGVIVGGSRIVFMAVRHRLAG